MGRLRWGAKLVAGCLFASGLSLYGADSPAPGTILKSFRPRQEGVPYVVPAPQQHDACKVELVKGARGGSGWLVRDPQGKPVCRFFDSDGDRKVDLWSYYKDGVEVYREIDSDHKGGGKTANEYRWLGAAGAKWGVDADRDGKIDSWKMISAEEVSQEVLQALVTKDAARLQALWISDAELKALELPAAETAKIQEARRGWAAAASKFQQLAGKLNLTDKTQWLRLETSPPQCLLAETTGGRQDILKYAGGTILYEHAGKHDFLQLGELIQVGGAWRLAEAPGEGAGAGPAIAAADPEVQKLLDRLRDFDKNPPSQAIPGANAEIAKYNVQRADLIEQIVGKVQPGEREQWIRQLADCLGAAMQHAAKGDTAASKRLTSLAEQIIKAMPGSPLAGYIVFREISADYAVKLAAGANLDKVQEQWLEKLVKFVTDYPKAEDTPDALLQLGMVNEFVGKEPEAKKWYDHLTKQFAGHALAAKAQGAVRRLESEGKVLDLAGPVLGGGTFQMAQVQGKLVVVYYWASWNQQCVGDFAKLKLLLDTHANKGLTLVCVNLDNTAEEATAFLRKIQAPGVHLFQPGGLDSPLATQYGVMVLPNLFLAKDGKILNRTVQVGNLEDEIKKALK